MPEGMRSDELFAEDGPLAASVEGFERRREQAEMASVVGGLIGDGSHAALEAATGLGKTFAYLGPSMVTGKKVIVSTSTKALQDQLYEKDIPQLKEALGGKQEVRVLKGRANYLCLHRMHLALKRREREQQELLPDGKDPDRVLDHDLPLVERFSRETEDGDIKNLRGLKALAKVRPLVTSTRESCIGRKCDHYGECHVYEAQRKAKEADLLVTNHSLLLAHARVEASDLFSGFEICVFDEAHELVEGIRKNSDSPFSIGNLAAVLKEIAELLEGHLWGLGDKDKARKRKRTQAGAGEELTLGAKEAGEVLEAVQAALEQCSSFLDDTEDLRENSISSKDFLTNVRTRAAFEGLVGSLDAIASLAGGDLVNNLSYAHKASEWKGNLSSWSEGSDERICWVDRSKDDAVFHNCLLEVDEHFKRSFLDNYCTILVSATLFFDGEHEHATDPLGMQDAEAKSWKGHFDYGTNSMLYLPDGVPDPSDDPDGFLERCVEEAAELVKANEGRAFVLFTSRKNLRKGAALMEKRLGGRYTVLTQGRRQPGELMRRFRASEGRFTVLLGTRMFMQGIDIKGDALSLVVIDKIPFPSPGEPIQAALKAKSEDTYFLSVSLPSAALALKQAAGRLIRSETDRGVVAVCDPRLGRKRYGKRIIDTLQPMTLTCEREDAVEFLRNMR